MFKPETGVRVRIFAHKDKLFAHTDIDAVMRAGVGGLLMLMITMIGNKG